MYIAEDLKPSQGPNQVKNREEEDLKPIFNASSRANLQAEADKPNNFAWKYFTETECISITEAYIFFSCFTTNQ